MKNSIVIFPYWPDFVVGLLILCYGILSSMYAGEPTLWQMRMYRFIIGVSSLVVFLSCFHASLHAEGIWVRFLWIPIRWIRWTAVSSAMYLTRWSTTGRPETTINGHVIVVGLRNCPKFNPEKHGLNLYALQHPLRVIRIRFTANQAKKILEFFQTCYPQLEPQCSVIKETE